MANSLTSRHPTPGTETNMDADYVIVYRFQKTGKAEAINKFRTLIEALASVGITSEVRNGNDHSLLVFVKIAAKEILYEEVHRSRTRDWLYGVRIAEPKKEMEASLVNDPLYPAERLRIVHSLITNPTDQQGAGITLGKGDWEEVESIFPLHDHEFNKKWIKKWASTTLLKVEDLDEIRNHLGEKVAFYFAFTQAYFTALIGIASFGVGAWVILGNFSPIYGLINSLLCIAFVEYWKFQQDELALRWGVKGVSAIEMKRHDFIPDSELKDPVTGEMTQVFPRWKRLQRQALQVPFALAAATALGFLIAMSFGIEIFISEVYSGPGKSILVYLPTMIMTTTQPLVLGLLTGMAERLTKYENYATTIDYEAALTAKMFILNFITSYLPIILTAFVYVPFASIIVPYLDVFSLIVQPIATSDKQMRTPQTGFHINPSRLKNQVIYFTVTAQIVNQVLEVVMPYIKQKGSSKFKEIKQQRAIKRGGPMPESVSANDPAEEKAFLNRVRQEVDLDEYDVISDFREMIVQYGYLALFSIVWPVTGVSFLINNWIELRSDAVKICIESRRPTPGRADGIGPWLNTLELTTWLGSITTAAIAYLFSNGGVGPDGSPRNLQAWLLLFTIFVSEHAYFVVRLAVRTFVSRLDSPARQKERTERYAIRKGYLEESMGRQASRLDRGVKNTEYNRSVLENEVRQSVLAHESVETKFWKRQAGWQETVQTGAWLIEKDADEGKKQQ